MIDREWDRYLILRDNRLFWNFLPWEVACKHLFQWNRIAVCATSIFGYSVPSSGFFPMDVISTGLLTVFHLQCIASLNTLWMKAMQLHGLNSGPSSNSRRCLSVCNTLGGFERLVIEVHSCCKNVLSIMVSSFTMARHGRLGEGHCFTS